MNRLNKIWTDLNNLTTDVQVLGYWENRQARIIDALKSTDSNFETSIEVIHRLAKSLNNRERYSVVWYLYKFGFQPIENKLIQSKTLDELKFELGRGLHHNRKYKHSKRLFNELASNGFDTQRINDWWNQTAFASTREKIWIKTDLLLAIVRLVIIFVYILIVFKTKEFIFSTTLFIILVELYQAWWYQYRVSNYLKEFDKEPEITEIKRNIKKKIWIEFGISLLFYPIYFLKQEWLFPLVLVIAAYFQVFHYGLNYIYLPRLIGELNRKNTTRQQAI